MSQSVAAVVDLSAMDLENFVQMQMDQLFSSVGTDQAIYHPDNSEAFDNLDFKFDLDPYPTPPDTTAPSSAPTPNFYTFGQSPDYPTPGPSIPHPYPIEQQCFEPNIAGFLPVHQRPRPLRSQTNTSYLAASHRPFEYARRRSLSQGDIDYITAINAQVPTPNPTFMRLQTPRNRSATLDGASRRRRTGQHSRSTSRNIDDIARQMQDNAPTSVPHLVNGKMLTRLGDPLSPGSPLYHRLTMQQQWPVQDVYTGCHTEDQVVLRPMLGSEQMQRSRKIIEIGAMALTGQVDPALQDNGVAILQKLEEVERYLKTECGACETALRGCVIIRDVVKGRLGMSDDISGRSKPPSSANFSNALESPSMLIDRNDGTADESEIDRLM